jgi:hypothetical protein
MAGVEMSRKLTHQLDHCYKAQKAQENSFLGFFNNQLNAWVKALQAQGPRKKQAAYLLPEASQSAKPILQLKLSQGHYRNLQGITELPH